MSRQLTSSLYFSTQPTEGGSDGKPNGNTAASGPIGGGDVVIGTKASQEGAPGVRQERRRVGGSGTRNSGNISGGRKLAGAMGLKEFMHRKRVLELYRGILKVREGAVCKANVFIVYCSSQVQQSVAAVVLRGKEIVQVAGNAL